LADIVSANCLAVSAENTDRESEKARRLIHELSAAQKGTKEVEVAGTASLCALTWSEVATSTVTNCTACRSGELFEFVFLESEVLGGVVLDCMRSVAYLIR
jgi:hypothetical protein